MTNLSKHILNHRACWLVPRITCKDGFSLSVQAVIVCPMWKPRR
jgi:hypothetical protein